MNYLTLILLDQAATQDQQGSFMPIILLIAFGVLFYFMFIRPQKKKQKELDKQRDALKKGDAVITSGGVHGKVVKVSDTTITIEVANGVDVKFEKSSVYAAPNAPAKQNNNQEKEEEAK